MNLILVLFLLWPVFPFTSQAATYPLSLPGLDSVQDLILCPIVSLWHTHNYFIKGHLCWWVLKSYFPPPFLNDTPIWPTSYFHFSWVSLQHAKLNKPIMIYWFAAILKSISPLMTVLSNASLSIFTIAVLV